MDKTEICEMVIREMVEHSLSVRRDMCSDEEKQNYKEVIALSEKANAVLAKLSEEDRAAVDDYFTKTNLIAQHECEYLYVQGAKDCVELLKKLGAL